MSMTLMVAAMKATVGNPLRKLVLIKLADQANDQGECWPSFAHIAEHCEITRRSVINHINALRNAGFLSVENRPGEKGNSSNLYHLHIAEGVERAAQQQAQNKGKQALEKPAKVVNQIHQGSERDSPGVVNHIHQGSEPDSPPLVKEIHPESVSFESVTEPTTTTPPLREALACPWPPSGSAQNIEHQPEPDNDKPIDHAFAMHLHWQPRVTPGPGGAAGPFADRCAMSGVNLNLVPTETRTTLLGEFLSYWETRPDENTQARWEHKFLQRLIDKKNRSELYATPASETTSTRSRSLAEDLTDRSWANANH